MGRNRRGRNWWLTISERIGNGFVKFRSRGRMIYVVSSRGVVRSICVCNNELMMGIGYRWSNFGRR